MKKIVLLCMVCWSLAPGTADAQITDTLVGVSGGYRLHFTIIKGKSAPILFESGMGNGADVWSGITRQISDVTDATVITYDRLSCTGDEHQYEIGIEKEISVLEEALDKLGYADKKLMLVAHSLGGMYGSYYASRHPDQVKAAVFIDDANVCSLSASLQKIKAAYSDTVVKYLAHIISTVEKNELPKNIPLVDIVADRQFDDPENADTVWISCHKRFAAQSPARKFLPAYNVGHFIFTDNPPLVINTIITHYANFVEPEQKTVLLEKGMALSTDMINDIKKRETKCGHSEEDLLTWGYALLEKNEPEKAIEVFKLNVFLHPGGWNNYDSLGEAYLKAGHKTLAIENYKKSLELNPKNDNAVNVLQQLK